jgi:hypothetical protein
MVRDRIPSRKRIKRRSSWKDNIKGLGSDSENDDNVQKKGHSTTHLKVPSKSAPGRSSTWRQSEEGAFADAESDTEDDYNTRKEEDRPISARILYKYDGSPDLSRSNSAVKREQQELSIALAEANTQAVKAMSGKTVDTENGHTKEPLGTRLTMTSRTGYFQDRIISPSMVCRLAMLCRPNSDSLRRCVLWLFYTLDPIGTQTLRPTITSLPF